MESKLPDNFRIEETPAIVGEKKEGELPAKVEPYDPVQLGITIGKMQAQIDNLTEQLNTKPVVEETTEETRTEPVPIPEQEPPKPKTVIPQGTATDDGPDDDGLFTF